MRTDNYKNMEIPKPTLGDVSAITIATPDLDKSFDFYHKLGFNELFRTDFPFPLIQISDGALLMMLRKDDIPYIALTYYVREIDTLAAGLEAEGIKFSSKPNPNDMIKKYLMKSPDGMNVSLVSFVDGFEHPKGASLLTTPPQDYSNPEKYVNKQCGLFGELAHPVADIDKSMEFWSKLGFKQLSRMTSPYPWSIISDGLSIIGLHQTSNFTNPTITFFASDMKDKIDKLKNEGLTGVTEKMGTANVTLATPEGQSINLFKLGM